MAGLSFAFPGFLISEHAAQADDDAGSPRSGGAHSEAGPPHRWEDDLLELSGHQDGEEADGDAGEACESTPEDPPGDLRRAPGSSPAPGPAARPKHSPHHLLALPDTVLTRIFTFLPWRDACRLLEASHALREAASAEDVWRQLYAANRDELLRLPPGTTQGLQREAEPAAVAAGGQRLSYPAARSRHAKQHALEQRLSRLGRAEAATDQALPGSLCQGCLSRSLALARSMSAAASIGERFYGLRQSHDQVRSAMDQYWEDPASMDTDKARRLVLKLTRFNWSLAYECLAAGFEHCADCAAEAVARAAVLYGRRGSVPTGSTSSTLALRGGGVHWCSCATCASWEGMGLERAKQLWGSVLLPLWDRYKRWLYGFLSICSALHDMVSAERAAEYMLKGNHADTPTLVDRGLAAFRSQVMVRFQTRPALQVSLSILQDARAADRDACSTLIDAWRALIEMNVDDDRTEPEATHTQDLFCRCYGLYSSTASDINHGKLTIPPPR